MRLVFVFVMVMTVSSIDAQSFIGGVVVGMNASQIDGDNTAGYNKFGFQAGARGGFRFSERSLLSIDILYSQRGSRHVPFDPSFDDGFTIKTDYIEVPVLFHYNDWKIESEDEPYYRVGFFGGLAASRLMNAEATGNTQYTAFVEDFVDFDISWTVGLNYYFSPHFGAFGRFNHSITRIFDNRNTTAEHSLRCYNFNFGLFYFL